MFLRTVSRLLTLNLGISSPPPAGTRLFEHRLGSERGSLRWMLAPVLGRRGFVGMKFEVQGSRVEAWLWAQDASGLGLHAGTLVECLCRCNQGSCNSPVRQHTTCGWTLGPFRARPLEIPRTCWAINPQLGQVSAQVFPYPHDFGFRLVLPWCPTLCTTNGCYPVTSCAEMVHAASTESRPSPKSAVPARANARCCR